MTTPHLSQTERYAAYEAAKTLATDQAFISAYVAMEARENDDELILCLRSLDVRKLASNSLSYRYCYILRYLSALHVQASYIIRDASLPGNTTTITVNKGTNVSNASSSSSAYTTNASSSSASVVTTARDEQFLCFFELLNRFNILGMNCMNGSQVVDNYEHLSSNMSPLKDWRDSHIHANLYTKPMIGLPLPELGYIGYSVTQHLPMIIQAVCLVTGKHLKVIMNETRRFLLQGIRLYFYEIRVNYEMHPHDRTKWTIKRASGVSLERARTAYIQEDNGDDNLSLEDTAIKITETYVACIRNLYDRLMNLSESDLRCLHYNDLYRMTEVEESFRLLYGNAEVASKLVYTFRFHSSIRGLKAPILDWRMQGARDLNSLAHDATNNETNATRKGFWIRCKEFIDLLESSNIMDDIVGERFHLEVMKSLPNVFRIIVSNKKWNQTLTFRLWLTSQNRHSADQCAILNQLNTVIDSEFTLAAEIFHDDSLYLSKYVSNMQFHHCYLPAFRQVCYLLEAAYLPVAMRSSINPYSNTEELLLLKRQKWALGQYKNGVSIETIIQLIGDMGNMRSYLQNQSISSGSSNVANDGYGKKIIESEIKVVPYSIENYTATLDMLLQPQVIPYIGLENSIPKAIEDLLQAMRDTVCPNDPYVKICLEKSTIDMFIQLLSKFYHTAPCPSVSAWTIPHHVEDLRFPALPSPDHSLVRSMDNMLSPCARFALRLLYDVCRSIEKVAFVTESFRDGDNNFVETKRYRNERMRYMKEFAQRQAEFSKGRNDSFFIQYLEVSSKPNHRIKLNFPPVLHGNSITYDCLENMCLLEGLRLSDRDSESNAVLSSSSSADTRFIMNDPSRLPRIAAFFAYMGKHVIEVSRVGDGDSNESSFNVLNGYTRRREKYFFESFSSGYVDFVYSERIVPKLLGSIGELLRRAIISGTEITGSTVHVNDPTNTLSIPSNANPLILHTFLAILHLLRSFLRFNMLDVEDDGKLDFKLLINSIIQRDLQFAQEGEIGSSIIDSTVVASLPTDTSAYVWARNLPGITMETSTGNELLIDRMVDSGRMDTTTMSTSSAITGVSHGKRSLSWAVENDPDWLILPCIPESNVHASVTIKDIRYLFELTKDNELARHALLLFIADGVGWNGPPDSNYYIQLLQYTRNHNYTPFMQEQQAGTAVPYQDQYLLSRRAEFIYELFHLLIDHFVCNVTNLANMDRYDLYAFRMVLFARNSNDDLWTQQYFDPNQLLSGYILLLKEMGVNRQAIMEYHSQLRKQLVTPDTFTDWKDLGSYGRSFFIFPEFTKFYNYLINKVDIDEENNDDKAFNIVDIFRNLAVKRPIHLLRPLYKGTGPVDDVHALQVASFDDIIGLGTLLHRLLLYTHSEGIWTSVVETLIGLAMAADPIKIRGEHINSLVNRVLSLLQRIDPTRSGSSNKRARSVNDELVASNIGSSSSNIMDASESSPSVPSNDLLSDEDIQQMSVSQRQECMRRLLFLYRRLIAEIPDRFILGQSNFFRENDPWDAMRLLRSHYDDNSADLTEVSVQVAVFDANEMRKLVKEDKLRYTPQMKMYNSAVFPEPLESIPYFLFKQQLNTNSWVTARKVTIKVTSNDTIAAIRRRIADLYHMNMVAVNPTKRGISNAPVWVFPGERTEMDVGYDVNRVPATLSIISTITRYGSDAEGYSTKIPILSTQITGDSEGQKNFLQQAEGLVNPMESNMRDPKLREYINNVLLTRSVQAGALLEPLASTGEIYDANCFSGWRAMVALDAGSIGSAHSQEGSTHGGHNASALLDSRVSAVSPAMPVSITDNSMQSSSTDFGNLFVAGGIILDSSMMQILLNVLSSPVTNDTDIDNISILESLRCEVWKTLNFALPTSPLVLGLLGSHRIPWNSVFASSSSVPSSPSFPNTVSQLRNGRLNSSGYSVPSMEEIGLSPAVFYGGTLASVYLLQSVVAYIRPSIEPLTWMTPNEGPVAWARRFIHEGGLQAILAYLLQASNVNDTNDEEMSATTSKHNASQSVNGVGLSSLVPKLLRTACLRIVLCLIEMPPAYVASPMNEFKAELEKLQKVYKVIPDMTQSFNNAMDTVTDQTSISDLVYSSLTNTHKESLIRLLWSQIAGEESESSSMANTTSLLSESTDTVMDTVLPVSVNPPVPPRVKRGRSLESSVDPSKKSEMVAELARIVTKDDDSSYFWYTNSKLLRHQTANYINSVVSSVNDRALRDGIKMLQLLIDNENKHIPAVTLSTSVSLKEEESAFERSIGPRQIKAVLRTLLYDPAKVGEDGQKALMHCIEKLIKESPRLAEAIVQESLKDITNFVALLDPENKALDAVIPLSMVSSVGDAVFQPNLRQHAEDICTGKITVDIQVPPATHFDLRGANIDMYMNLIKLAIDSIGKSSIASSNVVIRTTSSSTSASTVKTVEDHKEMKTILQLLMRAIAACSLSLVPASRTIETSDSTVLMSTVDSNVGLSVQGSNIGASTVSSSLNTTNSIPSSTGKVIYPFSAVPEDIAIFLNSLVGIANAAVNIFIPSAIDSVRLVNLILYHGLYRPGLPLLGSIGSTLDISTDSVSSLKARKCAWDITQAVAMPLYSKVKDTDSKAQMLRQRLVSETADFIRSILEQGNLPTRSSASPWLRYASLPIFNSSSHTAYTALSSARGSIGGIISKDSNGVLRTASGFAGNTIKAISMVLPSSFPSLEDISDISSSSGATMVPLVTSIDSAITNTVPSKFPASFFRLPRDIAFYTGLFVRLWSRLESVASQGLWEQHALAAGGELRQYCTAEESLNRLPRGFGQAIVDRLNIPIQRPNLLPSLLGGVDYESAPIINYIRDSNFFNSSVSEGIWSCLESEKIIDRLIEQALSVVSQDMDTSEESTGTYGSNLTVFRASDAFLAALTRYVLCYVFILLQAVARSIDPRSVTGLGLSVNAVAPSTTTTTNSKTSNAGKSTGNKDKSSTDTGGAEGSPSHSLPYELLYSASQVALSLYFGNEDKYSVKDLLSKSPFTVVDQSVVAIGNRSNPRIDLSHHNSAVKGYASLLVLANQEGYSDVDTWIGQVRLFSKTDHGSRELSLANLQNSSYIHYSLSDDFVPRYDAILGCYVGVKNQGGTCYQNGLIQQLFMIPALRYAILCAPPLPSNALEKYSYPDAVRKLRHEMQLLFTALCFSTRIYYDPLSFVLSCDNIPSGFFPLDSPVKSQNDASEFFSILLDRLGYVFPYPNVTTNQLIDTPAKSEDTVSPPTDNEPKLPSDIFAATIGGVIVNQMIGQGDCKHTNNREENFLSLSIDVEGNDSIEKSLTAFVQGEVLTGENAYMCEKCNKKVEALKRSCIASLPDNLIIHLKRFRLNYETFNKEKVNDALKFDFNVDLYPYTATGLSEAEGTLPKDSVPPHFITREDCLYELRGVLVHSGHAGGGHYYSFVCPRDGDSLPGTGSGLRTLAAQYRHRRNNLPAHVAQVFAAHAEVGLDIDALFAETEISGAIPVPASVSDSNTTNNSALRRNTTGWVEFNDETVAPFEASSANREAVWYGGVSSPTTGADGKQKSRIRTTNAFMLFYDRVRPVSFSSSATVSNTVSTDITLSMNPLVSRTSVPDGIVNHPVPKGFARTNTSTETNVTVREARQALRSASLPIVVPSTAADLIKLDNYNYLRSVYVSETPSVSYLCSAADKIIKTYETEANQIAAIYERAKLILQKRQPLSANVSVPLTEKYLQSSTSLYNIVMYADSIQRLLFGALAKQSEKTDTRELVNRAVRVLVSMAGNESTNKAVRDGTNSSKVTCDALLSDVMNVLQLNDTNVLMNEPNRLSITVSKAQGGIGTSDEGTQDAFRLDILENIVRGLVFPGLDIYWDTNSTTLQVSPDAAMIAAALTPTNSPKLTGKGNVSSNVSVPLTPTVPTIRDSRYLSSVFEVAFNQSKDGALTRTALKSLLPTVARMLGTIAEPLVSYINGENIDEEVTVLGLPYPLMSTEYRQQRVAQRNNQSSNGGITSTMATQKGNSMVDLTLDEAKMDVSSSNASESIPKQLVFQNSPLDIFRFTRASRALRALDLLVRTLLPFFGVVICNPVSDAYDGYVQLLIELVQTHPVVAAIMVRNHALEWVLQVLLHSSLHVWSSTGAVPVSPLDNLIGRMQNLTVTTMTGNTNTGFGNYINMEDADLATALLAISTPTAATEGRQLTTFSENHTIPLYALLSMIIRTTYIPDLSENERDSLVRPTFAKLIPIETSSSITSLVSTSVGGSANPLTHEQSPYAIFPGTTIRPRFRTSEARDILLDPAWIYRFTRPKVIPDGFAPILLPFLSHLSFGNPHISSMVLIALADLTFRTGTTPRVLDTVVNSMFDELVTSPKLNLDGFQVVRLASVLYSIDERRISRGGNSSSKLTLATAPSILPFWTVPNFDALEFASHDKRYEQYGTRTLPFGTLLRVPSLVVETVRTQGLNPWMYYVFGSEENRQEQHIYWTSITASLASDNSSSSSSANTHGSGFQTLRRFGLVSYILDIVSQHVYKCDDNEDLAGPAPKRLETFMQQRDRIDPNLFDFIAESILLVYRIWSKATPMVREAMMKLPTFVPWVPTVRDVLAFANDRIPHILTEYSNNLQNEWKTVFTRSVTYLHEMTGIRSIRFSHRYTTARSVLPHQYLEGGADPSVNTAIFNPDAVSNVSSGNNDPDGSNNGNTNIDQGDNDVDRNTEPTGAPIVYNPAPVLPHGRTIVGAGTGEVGTIVPGRERINQQMYNPNDMDEKGSIEASTGGDDEDRKHLLQDEYDHEDVQNDWDSPGTDSARITTNVGDIYGNPDHAMDLGTFARPSIDLYARYEKEPVEPSQISTVLANATLPDTLPQALATLCGQLRVSWDKLPEIISNLPIFIREEQDLGSIITNPEHLHLWSVWAVVESAVGSGRMELENFKDIDALCSSIFSHQSSNAHRMLNGTLDKLALDPERWPIYIAAYGYVPLITSFLTKSFTEFKKDVIAYWSPPSTPSDKQTFFEGGNHTGYPPPPLPNSGKGLTNYGTTTTTTVTNNRRGMTTTISTTTTGPRYEGGVPHPVYMNNFVAQNIIDESEEISSQEEEMRLMYLRELDSASRSAITEDRSSFDGVGSDTEEYSSTINDGKNNNLTETEVLITIDKVDTNNRRINVLTWAMFRQAVETIVKADANTDYVFRWILPSPKGLPPVTNDAVKQVFYLSNFDTFIHRIIFILREESLLWDCTQHSVEHCGIALAELTAMKKNILLSSSGTERNNVDIGDEEIAGETAAQKLEELAIEFISAVHLLFMMRETLKDTVLELHNAIRVNVTRDVTRDSFWRILSIAENFLNLKISVPVNETDNNLPSLHISMLLKNIIQIIANEFNRVNKVQSYGTTAFHVNPNNNQDTRDDTEDEIIGAVFIADYFSWLLAFAKNINAVSRQVSPSLTTMRDHETLHLRSVPTTTTPTMNPSPFQRKLMSTIPPTTLPNNHITEIKNHIVQLIDQTYDENEEALKDMDILFRKLLQAYTVLYNSRERAINEISKFKNELGLNLLGRNFGGIPDTVLDNESRIADDDEEDDEEESPK